MLILEVALDAFGAELTGIEGEILPRLESNYLVVLDFELDSALLSAKAAMGFDDAVWLTNRRPTLWRSTAEVRAKPVDELRNWSGKFRHKRLR